MSSAEWSFPCTDVDDEDEEEDDDETPEEGFVEQAEIHDTTAADIYRGGRAPFLPGEEFVHRRRRCSDEKRKSLFSVKWIQQKWKKF